MKKVLNKLSQMAEANTERIAQEKKAGKPLVVYTSTFVPEEIIRASGVSTYLLCRGGEIAPAKAAMDYTIEYINPLARASVGYIISGTDRIASMADLVVTAFSDSHMSRMSELLEYKGVNIFKIGVPTDWQKQISFDYYLHSLRAMLKKVEDISGKAADMELAREYFAASNRKKACFRRLKEQRKGQVIPIGIEDTARLHNISFALTGNDAVEALERFIDKAENSPSLFDADAPRLLMIMRAAPSGDYSILRLIDETGCPVVATVMDECACVTDSDVALDGDLVESFAKSRYNAALPLNSFQPSWKIRFERIRDMIDEYRVDGVIWYQLAFDEIYDMEFVCVSRWLDELNVPVTRVETDYDYSPENLTAKKAQINSFVNLLKKRKSD